MMIQAVMGASVEIAPTPPSSALLVLIFGQSNAVGFNTGAPSEPYLNDPITGVNIWTGSQFDTLEYGVNNEGSNGHGVELNLGYLLNQNYNLPVYIVKNASNGSALGNEIGNQNKWDKGTGDLYAPMISEVNAAISYLNTNQINYTWACAYWDQGERDANIDYLASVYETNLTNLISNIRADITNGSGIPFITVRLSSAISRTYLTQIRNAQVSVAGSVANTDYVNVDDLALQLDNLHRTSASQNSVAQRIYDIINA